MSIAHNESTPAHREAAAAASGPAERLLERLAGTLGSKTSVSAAFGDPVERDGVTVIPVAKAKFGFGGGAGVGGDGTEGPNEGGGGGGGAMVTPVGYVVIRDGDAEYRPLRADWEPWAFGAAGALAAVVGLRVLGRLFRRG
ncbi:spore germination protein GerW family protein [Yinghuangia seranimata]|uniref:spore germination protein GerW family protein n=1 Tax=Yinghuangia seranimata TaxID=408067 RepID=UPI00248B88CC|nr:spore germination protein GerW family protein [Yinghuangia seranimata]MDI2131883.1 spore germination protein GerW family protein [Yinghuangia seranimata]